MTQKLTMTLDEVAAHNADLAVNPADYSKPIRLYLDVDGVVSPFVRTVEDMAERFPEAPEVSFIPVGLPWSGEVQLVTGLFAYDPTITQRLSDLSHSPLVDVVWLTSLRANAPMVLDELLNIKSLGYLPWQMKMADYAQSFKQVAIVEEQEEYPSKFIWIDDVANKTYADSPLFYPEDIIADNQYLSITTNSFAGLTHSQLDLVDKWIAANT